MFARLLLLLFYFMVASSHLFATAERTWEVIVPTMERSSIEHVHVLPNKDFLVAGNASLSTPNFSGIWVARYTSAGDQVWSREFIGNAHSRASQLLVGDQRIIVAGSHLVRNPFQSDASGFIVELDLDGRIVWKKWIEEAGSSIWISKFDELENGDFLVSGGVSKRDNSIRDAAFFSRLSATGEIKWSFYPVPEADYYDDLPQPTSTTRDRDGNVVLREAAGPVREQDNGELHLHIYRRELMSHNDQVGRCVIVSATGVLLEGKSCSRLNDVEVGRHSSLRNVNLKLVSPGLVFANQIEVSFSQSGEADWSWQLQSEHKSGLTDAISTSDGGIIGVGYIIIKSEPKLHRYDAVVFRLDSEGNEIWSHIYRSDRRDIFTRVVALNDDSYIIVGHTGAIAQSDWWDPWIIRIGADGEVNSQTEVIQ